MLVSKRGLTLFCMMNKKLGIWPFHTRKKYLYTPDSEDSVWEFTKKQRRSALSNPGTMCVSKGVCASEHTGEAVCLRRSHAARAQAAVCDRVTASVCTGKGKNEYMMTLSAAIEGLRKATPNNHQNRPKSISQCHQMSFLTHVCLI